MQEVAGQHVYDKGTANVTLVTRTSGLDILQRLWPSPTDNAHFLRVAALVEFTLLFSSTCALLLCSLLHVPSYFVLLYMCPPTLFSSTCALLLLQLAVPVEFTLLFSSTCALLLCTPVSSCLS